jgi:hypothetical protein
MMLTHTNKAFRYGAIAALSLASVFASSAVAMASPVANATAKADLVVQGTVTVLTPSTGTPTSLTIQPHNPNAPTENILLSATTIYKQAGANVTVAALALGEPVQIALTGSPATAQILRILSPEPIFVGGTVTALSPSTGTPTSVTIQPRDLKKPTVNIDLGTSTLYYLGGKITPVTSLMVGSQVELEATGNPATATVVEIAVPKPVVIDGTVTALSPSTGTPTSVTILPYFNHAVALSVDLGSSTVYRQSGAVVTVADLLVGSKVEVVASGNPQTATIVRIAVPKPVVIDGTVTALSPTTGTPTSVTILPYSHHAVALSVDLGSSTVYRQSGAVVTVADLLVGSKVEVVASGNPLTASTVRIAVPKPVIIEGMVTELNPSSGTPTSVTIEPGHFKAPVTVELGSSTVYYQLKAVTTVAALLVGSYVDVSASGNPLVASAVHISAPLADITIGSVISVTNAQLIVQPETAGSLPVTFALTDTTTYFAGRKISTIAEINVGDVVRVAAAPSASLTAVFVTVRNMVIVGRVTSVVGDVISVTGFYGSPLTIDVTSSTVYRSWGRNSSLRSVRIGDLVVGLGPAISGVTNSVTATNVWIGTRDNSIYHYAWVQHQDHGRRNHR